LLDGLDGTLIDLAKRLIGEAIQLDDSIKESINRELLKIQYQVSSQLERRKSDHQLNRINADLKLLNQDILKSFESLFDTGRVLMLNRINTTLEEMLIEMRGWTQLNQRKAKKLMEARLNELRSISLKELNIIEAEIFKLTKIKIEKIKLIVRAFFEKHNVNMLMQSMYGGKCSNNCSKPTGYNQYLKENSPEKIYKDLIHAIEFKESYFINVINRLFQRKQELQEEHLADIGMELIKVIKNIILMNPSFLKSTTKTTTTTTTDAFESFIMSIFIAGYTDGNIKLWTLTHPSPPYAVISKFTDSVLSIVPLPNRMLAVGYAGGLIRFWDAFNTIDPLLVIDTLSNDDINKLFVLENLNIVSGSSTGMIRIHQYSLSSSPTTSTTLKEFSNGGNSEVTGLGFVNNLLVTSSRDGFIRFWNLNSTPNPTLSKSINENSKVINSMIVHKNGLVIGCFDDGTVKGWSPSNTQNAFFSYTGSSCNSIIEMSNGNLVFGGDDGKVKIITPTSTPQLVREFETDSTPIKINVISLLPDLTVATGSEDGNIRVWNVLDAYQLLRTYQSTSSVKSLSRVLNF